MTRVLTLLLCPYLAYSAGLTQTGTVKWQNQPLPGVVVIASRGDRQITTATNEQGAYEIEGLEPGAWSIHLELFGFRPVDREVEVSGAQPAMSWTMELSPPAISSPSRDAAEARAESDELGPENTTATTPGAAGNISESFVINGSLSRGLQPAGPDVGSVRGVRNPNSFRGTLGWTGTNSALDARPYSISGQNVPKAAYNQNRFNVTLAGPLAHRRSRWQPTFLFSYGRVSGRNPFNAYATVPTLLERSGDFSRSIASAGVTVYDPQTGQPFENDRIPAARIRPAAAGLMNLIPVPNQPGDVQNYAFVSHVANDSDAVSGTVNFRLSGKDRFSFVQTYNRGTSESLQTFGFRDRQRNNGWTSTASWTRTMTGHLILSSYVSVHDTTSNTVPFFASSRNVAAELGIKGTSQDPLNYGPPNLNFTNFGSLSDVSALLHRDAGADIGVTLYQSAGSHNLSYGLTYSPSRLNIRTDEDGRGTFLFSGLATSAFDSSGNAVANTGFDFADFLLGLPESGSVRYGASQNKYRAANYALFLTEDWAVLPNFSLTMGLRYDFFGPFTEDRNRMANLDIARGFTGASVVLPGGVGAYTGSFPRSLIEPDRNNWGPRFGFAWQPVKGDPLNIRSGYGVYYNGVVYQQAAQRLASQPPFANTGNLTSSAALPLTLETGFLAAASQDVNAITNTYAVAKDYSVGYAQIWNFIVSRPLKGAVLLEFGYLGTKGTHLDIQRYPNRAAPGSPLSSEQRRIIPYAGGFLFDSSEGDSTLHAGQVRVVRRLRSGMSANFFYTFGKMIDNASTYGGGLGVAAQNDQNLRAERGLSSLDVRHTINASFALFSPVGAGSSTSHGLFTMLGRGWSLQGGVAFTSGHWLTARALGNRADAAGSGSVGNARADATGLPVTVAGYLFNPAAFAIPAAGAFGSAGRNTIPTPPTLSFNATFGRVFRLGDRMRLDLRAESNNIGNMVNVTGFGTIVNASNYGVATALAPMRTVTLRGRLQF